MMISPLLILVLLLSLLYLVSSVYILKEYERGCRVPARQAAPAAKGSGRRVRLPADRHASCG